MATLFCSVSGTGQTTAYLDGYFTGGDSGYSRYRYLDLYLNGTFKARIESDEAGGSESDFAYSISGLSAGTTYAWSVTMLYVDGQGNYVTTSYTASGTFHTDNPPPPPPTTGPHIWNGSEWKKATPYIWDGSAWQPATAYIWNGSNWQS